ncbi:xanthine dehydrogenase family protein subunit M [Micromonospora sp. CPCC 205371]|nr:xanthine dehydrogenase family protein subunit M [Micromonospora sp. CPCC 205371]
MIPAAFEYTKPSTVDEAVRALAEGGEDARVLAGGQSLIPMLRLRMAAPTLLVDLGGLGELRGVRDDGDALVIGAMTRYADLLRDPLVRDHAPLLAQATATVADRQVRHLGTIGGSLAEADPAGDLPSVAVALDVSFEVVGPGGWRTISAADFFVDFLTTALGDGEMLGALRVPKQDGWGTHYEKFSRVAQAWSIVGVAVAVRRENGTIAEARVGLTSMGNRPLRARAVEEALAGAPATAEAVSSAAARAAEGADPPTDVWASAEYRSHLATVLTRRAVVAAGGIHAS